MATGKDTATIFSNTLTNVKSINLISCFSANGGVFSHAQILSNTLNILVKGYYGKINLHNPNITGKHCKVFKPQTGWNPKFTV